MKKLLVVLILIASGIFILYFLNDRKEKETEAKCRAEFSKMLYEDANTKAILNLADPALNPTRSMEWKSQNNLKNFQDYVNAETTSCADRQAALTEFKNGMMKEIEDGTKKMIDDIRAGKK